jgi:hypothetical protein
MRSSKLDSRSDDRLISPTQAAWEKWQTITRTLQGRDHWLLFNHVCYKLIVDKVHREVYSGDAAVIVQCIHQAVYVTVL